MLGAFLSYLKEGHSVGCWMLKVFRAGGRGAGECMVLQVLCDLLTLGLPNIHAAVNFLQFFSSGSYFE